MAQEAATSSPIVLMVVIECGARRQNAAWSISAKSAAGLGSYSHRVSPTEASRTPSLPTTNVPIRHEGRLRNGTAVILQRNPSTDGQLHPFRPKYVLPGTTDSQWAVSAMCSLNVPPCLGILHPGQHGVDRKAAAMIRWGVIHHTSVFLVCSLLHAEPVLFPRLCNAALSTTPFTSSRASGWSGDLCENRWTNICPAQTIKVGLLVASID